MQLRLKKSHLITGVVLALALVISGYSAFSEAFEGRAAPFSPACQPAGSAATARTFYVDPQRGTDDGDGSLAHPWRSLQSVIDANLVGSQFSEIPRHHYWLARLTGQRPVARLYDNPHNIVGDGDTIRLASGDHGALTIKGIYNRAAITISGMPGAKAHFSSVQIEGSANFLFKDFEVRSTRRPSAGRYLVNLRPTPRSPRSNNITFVGVQVGGTESISSSSPEQWAKKSSDGILMFGECQKIEHSVVHDVHTGIALYQVTNARVEDVEIRDFSVDGLEFSGTGIVIRNNVIRDHWPTGDELHPDCMQGQSTPDNPRYGNILIEGNICLSDTSTKRSVRLQGINIFNGDWSNVTVRCNFVRPTISHGISMYGIKKLTIDSNIVIGWPGIYTAWISAMPSLDQRDPAQNTIANNQATGYLNAIHGGPQSVAAMMKNHQVNRFDAQITETLSRRITGVSLDRNAWLNPVWDMATETRFKRLDRPGYTTLISVEQAKADLAAMPGCTI